MLVVVRRKDGRGFAGQRDDLAAIGLLEHGAGECRRGRPERDLPAVEAEHPLEAARLLEVVRGDEQAAAFAGELVE